MADSLRAINVLKYLWDPVTDRNSRVLLPQYEILTLHSPIYGTVPRSSKNSYLGTVQSTFLRTATRAFCIELSCEVIPDLF